jgi:hypothetical protein
MLDSMQLCGRTVLHNSSRTHLHKMYVVQEHPATFLHVPVKGSLGRLFLPLTHGDESEVAFLDAVAVLVGIHLQVLCGGVTREQDEEDRCLEACLGHHGGEREGGLVGVLGAHDKSTELAEGIGDAVGPECANDQQLAEAALDLALTSWCYLFTAFPVLHGWLVLSDGTHVLFSISRNDGQLLRF